MQKRKNTNKLRGCIVGGEGIRYSNQSRNIRIFSLIFCYHIYCLNEKKRGVGYHETSDSVIAEKRGRKTDSGAENGN